MFASHDRDKRRRNVSGSSASETLEHHYQQSREVKTLDNKYVQIDLCWANCATGSYLMWAWTVPVTPGKVRQDREGLRIMGSFQGYDMWRYSQQDLIDSGLGGGKASRHKLRQRRRRKQPQPNHLASVFYVSAVFFSFSFLGHSPACAAHFVHFLRIVTEVMQGRTKIHN